MDVSDKAFLLSLALGLVGLVVLVCLLAYLWYAAPDPDRSAHLNSPAIWAPAATPAQLVTITQSVLIGTEQLPPGTRVELVSTDGSIVHVRYSGVEYGIPISATDLKAP